MKISRDEAKACNKRLYELVKTKKINDCWDDLWAGKHSGEKPLKRMRDATEKVDQFAFIFGGLFYGIAITLWFSNLPTKNFGEFLNVLFGFILFPFLLVLVTGFFTIIIGCVAEGIAEVRVGRKVKSFVDTLDAVVGRLWLDNKRKLIGEEELQFLSPKELENRVREFLDKQIKEIAQIGYSPETYTALKNRLAEFKLRHSVFLELNLTSTCYESYELQLLELINQQTKGAKIGDGVAEVYEIPEMVIQTPDDLGLPPETMRSLEVKPIVL